MLENETLRRHVNAYSPSKLFFFFNYVGSFLKDPSALGITIPIVFTLFID